MDLLEKLGQIESKFSEIESKLSDPVVLADAKRFKELSKSHSDLNLTVQKSREYRQVLQNRDEALSLLESEKDSEMRAHFKEELENAKSMKETLESEIKLLMIPKDPLDDQDAFLEIRQGTGGEEAALFAAELFQMYKRFCENHGMNFELISFSAAEAGGCKEVIAQISGKGSYGMLKYESGIHRVQRVPKTEASGRVHTSAATVAIIPQQDEVQLDINPADLKIDTFRASGAGGQHINKTDSAVRITHVPTGFVVASQESRSQHRNREIAFSLLKSRILEEMQNKQQKEQAQLRKTLVGSGDRSEKIRTYNFPQNRITDHRIGLTLYRIDDVMKGDLDEIISALQTADRVQKLQSEQNS